MKVINLFGGPGTGKSTAAAGLFFQMKLQGFRVELVTEFAKDLVWEEHQAALEDQLYVLAEQNRRLHRLRGKVDWVITDSPLLLSGVYASSNTVPSFWSLLNELWESYENVNFYLPRDSSFKYESQGRLQSSVAAATGIDADIAKILPANTHYLTYGTDYLQKILKTLPL